MTSKIPTFSICIPNYNYAHYIGETIQSVLDQTYQNFEIVIADNASTDNSVEVIESFEDSRIRLIKNRYNIGFAPNLQRATMYARNDFVNLLSSDDLMRPQALERYAEVISKQGGKAHNTVLMSDTDVVNGRGKTVGRITRVKDTFESVLLSGNETDKIGNSPQLQYYQGLDVLKSSLSHLRTFAPFLSIVYPRRLWEQVEGYNSVRTIGPDKHFNYKLLAQNPEVVYVPEPLFGYRVHGSVNQQAQQTNLKQQIDDYLYTIEFSDDFLDKLDLTRQDLIREFLDRVCLKNGLTQLVYGTYAQAFRMLAFALAAYPVETLKRPRTYMLGGLLLLGPLGKLLAQPLYKLYRWGQSNPEILIAE